MSSRKVIITEDKDNFVESSCTCKICTEMTQCGNSEMPAPDNNVTKRLLKVIEKYEKQNKTSETQKSKKRRTK